MSQLRTLTLDHLRPGNLRAGIKWDSLARDNLEEFYKIESPDSAAKRLKAIPKYIFLLKLLANFFRATFVLDSVAENIEALRKSKMSEGKALGVYLSQRKLLSFDLDLCCFCYDGAGKLIGYALPDVTEMNGKKGFNECFLHSGDDLTGTGDAFDEELIVNLQNLSPVIQQVVFVVVSVNHGFNKIKGGSWTLISTKAEQELMSVLLKTEGDQRLHIMARASRNDTVWTIDEVAEYHALENDPKIPVQNQIDKLLKGKFCP